MRPHRMGAPAQAGEGAQLPGNLTVAGASEAIDDLLRKQRKREDEEDLSPEPQAELDKRYFQD